jgi:hypothetical protein
MNTVSALMTVGVGEPRSGADSEAGSRNRRFGSLIDV